MPITANNPSLRIAYWYSINAGAGQPPPEGSYSLRRVDGGTAISAWHDATLGAQPSDADIDAVDESAAQAWLDGHRKDVDADADSWSPRERALARMVFRSLTTAPDTDFTWQQFKAALRAEM